MSLKTQIEADIKAAMLEKKKDELTALRAIKSAILLAETEKGAGGNLTEEAEMKLLTKAVKQRRDSADIYQQEKRQDLADKELFELEVISHYLPKQLSDDELEEGLKEIVESLNAEGMKDMGKVMGTATKRFAGKADGKKISELVKGLLGG